MTRAADTFDSFTDLRAGAGQGWAAIHESNTAHEVAGLRSDLEHATDAQLGEFNQYTRSLYGGGDVPAGRRGHMADWVADAPDREVADLLARDQAARHEQERAVQPDFDMQHGYFARWTDWGVRQGFITQHRTPTGRYPIVERLNGMRLVMGDVRDTTWRGQASYYDSAANAVVIAPSTDPDPRARIGVAQERTRVNTWREMARVYGRTLPNWARDGFAEHLNVSVASSAEGRPADHTVFDPEIRAVQGDMFIDQRKLLHTAFYEAAGPQRGAMIAESFLRAATSNNLHGQESAEFNDLMSNAWRHANAFGAISDAVGRQREYLQDAYPGHDGATYEQWACQAVTEVLQSNDLTPIFGAGYQKPRAHMGAAAVGVQY
jgi:hypothetical protein